VQRATPAVVLELIEKTFQVQLSFAGLGAGLQGGSCAFGGSRCLEEFAQKLVLSEERRPERTVSGVNRSLGRGGHARRQARDATRQGVDKAVQRHGRQGAIHPAVTFSQFSIEQLR